jgi:hypothetical protein
MRTFQTSSAALVNRVSGALPALRALLLLLAAALALSACVERTVPIGGFPDVDEGVDATVPPPPGQLLFAGYSLKSLSFIWAKVEQTSSYHILMKTGPGTGYSQISGEIDGIGDGPFSYTDTLQLHLTDWSNTSYIFEACNAQGCTGSDDSLDVNPPDSVSIIGYMKPFDPVEAGQFGYSLAYSADGATLAVGTCPQGFPPETGAVYVYAYDGANWTEQAKLKGSRELAQTNYGFGCAVALSGAGDVLAIGAVNDSSPATGIDPEPAGAGAASSGAVYVFRRTGSAWAEEAYIKASNTDANDSFGRSLALARDGSTLAVGAINEDSNAAGIYQSLPHDTEDNDLASNSGAVYVYAHDDTGWSQQAYIKAAVVKGSDWFGAAVALADDGNTLAVGANGVDTAGIGMTDDCGSAQGENNCIQDSGAVYTFTRAGGVWNQQGYIKALNPGEGDGFGGTLAMSADGGVLAVGAPAEDSAATGIDGNPVNDCDAAEEAQINCAENSGAAYLFRRANNLWAQDAYVKASNTEAGTFPASADAFGSALALSGDGAILVVGAPREDSFVSGVNVPIATDSRRNSGRDSGAVYVYRNEVFISFVKASAGERPATDEYFGQALALSADSASLAVSAIGNDCPFTGASGKPVYSGLTSNGMQPDLGVCGSPLDSGAVYLY